MMERLLSWYARHKIKTYMHFESSKSGVVPVPMEKNRYMLYLHVPFCETLCPYCSFNRIRFEPGLAERYFRSLRMEIAMYKDLGYIFNSLYLGGGTPTILPGELERTMNVIRGNWDIRQASVETNPNHLTPEIIRVLLGVGINRLSVGVQSFDDRLLKKLQRLEKYGSGEDIRRSLSKCMGKFDTLNADLIFNLPGQTLEMVKHDTRVIKDLCLDQATFYPLMASKMKREDIRQNLGSFSYAKEHSFYREIRNEMVKTHSQVSTWCFSRKTGMLDEFIVENEEYAGLGCGAFGYLGDTLYANTFSVPEYIASLEKGILPTTGVKHFSDREREQYDLLMGLFGQKANLYRFREKYGRRYWFKLLPELAFLFLSGTVRRITARPGDDYLLLKPERAYYVVLLMREFFNGVNNLREIRLKMDNETLPEIGETVKPSLEN